MYKRQGKSVVVEYIGDEMNVIETEAATNFLLTPGDYPFGKGQDRYDTIVRMLAENKYSVSEEEAMEILEAAKQEPSPEKDSSTQWSCVYNLTDLTLDAVSYTHLAVPKGLVFWRSFTHWVGGMGVLVFVLAIIPNLNGSAVHLLKAESPGPVTGKFVPKIRESAKILYTIYFMMSVVQVILLLASGLSLYDSLITTMGSAGTGGFSNLNLSVGGYNNVAAEVITLSLIHI